ncbi:MAG: radical SAM protein [Thermoleophilia bacterium]|jgi:biotin synthase
MNNNSYPDKFKPDHIQAPAEISASLDLNTNTIIDFGSGCINLFLIYPEPCDAGCSFCYLGAGTEDDSAAKDGVRRDRALCSVDEMIVRVAENRNMLSRVCISATVHPGSFGDAIFLVEKVAKDLNLPVSLKINPLSLKPGDLHLLRDAGAGKIALVLDAATEDLYYKHCFQDVDDGRVWNNCWETLEAAASVFGSESTFCQLITGLGETEQQLLVAIQNMHDIGAMTNLFPFYADDSSLLEGGKPCPTGQFRRMQLASFLIDNNMSAIGHMQFDEEDRVISFGLKGRALEAVVDSGKPFKSNHNIGARPCARIWLTDIKNCEDTLKEQSSMMRSSMSKIRKQLATYSETGITARPAL